MQARDSVTLGPLDADAVRLIAGLYVAAGCGDAVPVEALVATRRGVARRVHEAAGEWARREATRRVDATAGRVAAGRSHTRALETELTGNVIELRSAHDRVRQISADGEGHDETVGCPYKGLATFNIDDAEYFFGREQLVAELVARLVGVPLLGAVGPSGSGKSSVVRTGLLHALAGGVLPGSERWSRALIRPGEHPMRELRAASGRLGDGRVLLCVDQFESSSLPARTSGNAARSSRSWLAPLAIQTVRVPWCLPCARISTVAVRPTRSWRACSARAHGHRLHRQIGDAAQAWHADARDPGGLYRGARLAGAVEWRSEHEPELNGIERSFLDASRSAAERAQRRLRLVLGAVAALLAVAVVAGIVAFDQRGNARAKERAAAAQALDAQALAEPALDRSLLLARDAVSLVDSPATRSYLLAALLRSPAAIGVLRGDGDPLLSVAVSPDGRTLAFAEDDGAVRFFDALTRRQIWRPYDVRKNRIPELGYSTDAELEYSPDGTRLAVADHSFPVGGFIDLLDARAHRRIAASPSRNRAPGVAPSHRPRMCCSRPTRAS